MKKMREGIETDLRERTREGDNERTTLNAAE